MKKTVKISLDELSKALNLKPTGKLGEIEAYVTDVSMADILNANSAQELMDLIKGKSLRALDSTDQQSLSA